MSGKAPLEGESALMYLYGVYLLNGGSKEEFFDLSFEDLQIMSVVALSGIHRNANAIAQSISKLFRGKDE